MKKLLCLVLALVLSMSLFAACGNNEESPETDNTAITTDDKSDTTENEPSGTPTTNDVPEKDNTKENTSAGNDSTAQTEVIKPSENSDNTASYYLILNGTNEENISYHTEKCPLLKDKEIQKTSWEMIKMLQFRHCAKCNPPKYEGYVE